MSSEDKQGADGSAQGAQSVTFTVKPNETSGLTIDVKFDDPEEEENAIDISNDVKKGSEDEKPTLVEINVEKPPGQSTSSSSKDKSKPPKPVRSDLEPTCQESEDMIEKFRIMFQKLWESATDDEPDTGYLKGSLVRFMSSPEFIDFLTEKDNQCDIERCGGPQRSQSLPALSSNTKMTSTKSLGKPAPYAAASISKSLGQQQGRSTGAKEENELSEIVPAVSLKLSKVGELNEEGKPTMSVKKLDPNGENLSSVPSKSASQASSAKDEPVPVKSKTKSMASKPIIPSSESKSSKASSLKSRKSKTSSAEAREEPGPDASNEAAAPIPAVSAKPSKAASTAPPPEDSAKPSEEAPPPPPLAVSAKPSKAAPPPADSVKPSEAAPTAPPLEVSAKPSKAASTAPAPAEPSGAASVKPSKTSAKASKSKSAPPVSAKASKASKKPEEKAKDTSVPEEQAKEEEVAETKVNGEADSAAASEAETEDNEENEENEDEEKELGSMEE